MADMDKVLKGLQDTLTVMEGIQGRQAAIMKDHSDWLQEHDRAMAKMRTEMREREARIDAHIEKLVIAIGEFVRRSS